MTMLRVEEKPVFEIGESMNMVIAIFRTSSKRFDRGWVVNLSMRESFSRF